MSRSMPPPRLSFSVIRRSSETADTIISFWSSILFWVACGSFAYRSKPTLQKRVARIRSGEYTKKTKRRVDDRAEFTSDTFLFLFPAHFVQSSSIVNPVDSDVLSTFWFSIFFRGKSHPIGLPDSNSYKPDSTVERCSVLFLSTGNGLNRSASRGNLSLSIAHKIQSGN